MLHLTQIPAVVKNGINVVENIGKVEDVAKVHQNVLNKMNGIPNA